MGEDDVILLNMSLLAEQDENPTVVFSGTD